MGMGALLTGEKSFGFFCQKACSLLRAYFLCHAQKVHTCSLRSIFPHAHVAVKNDLNFLPPAGGKLCEAFNIFIVCQKNVNVNPFRRGRREKYCTAAQTGGQGRTTLCRGWGAAHEYYGLPRRCAPRNDSFFGERVRVGGGVRAPRPTEDKKCGALHRSRCGHRPLRRGDHCKRATARVARTDGRITCGE